MEPLSLTQNDDGTLTLNGVPADPVSVSDQLWADLEANDEYVEIERRPPGSQGQPAQTFLKITATNYWLTYTVRRHVDGVYELELGGYAER